jgi:serine protease Do
MHLRLTRALGIALLVCAAIDCRAGLVEVVAKSKPSVVVVGTFDALDNPRFGFRGTGFVVADGHHVVTNAHVLPEPSSTDTKSRLVVQVPGGANGLEMRAASLVSVDATHDLALLRIEGPALPALAIADSIDIHEGESIAFIGFPIGGVLGFSPVTHRGIISSITAIALPMPLARQLNEKAIKRLRAGSFDIYQLDATAYPGNSGGPVLDIKTGDVVGVINMVLVKSTKESALSQPSGISYAVPARFVGELLKSL